MRSGSSGSQVVNVGVASTILVPYSPTRVALVISAPLTNPMFLALRQAAASAGGILCAAGDPPLVLTLGDHGALVMGPISAIIPAGAENVTYWDAHVPERID